MLVVVVVVVVYCLPLSGARVVCRESRVQAPQPLGHRDNAGPLRAARHPGPQAEPQVRDRSPLQELVSGDCGGGAVTAAGGQAESDEAVSAGKAGAGRRSETASSHRYRYGL